MKSGSFTHWVLILFLCLGFLAESFVPANAQTTIRYVDRDAVGANDGSSWANAFTDLQAALAAASNGDEIWVAAGVYAPTTTGDRTVSFAMKNGVGIYGGFAGTETLRSQRNWTSNVTTLSGDIGTAGDAADNSYHIFNNTELNATAVLDGFIISGANSSNASYPDNMGGGMVNNYSSPTLANLVFSGNSANNGGGMYNNISSPSLTNIIFTGNHSITWGGGILNNQSGLILTNVVFIGNSGHIGGGMYNNNSQPTLTNVTFTGNNATNHGGGMVNSSSNTIIHNSILWGNTANWNPNISNYDSTPTIDNSLVDVDPLFADAANGNLHPIFSSPARNAGNNAFLPADLTDLDGDGNITEQIPYDLSGDPRVFGANVDIGAFEVQLTIAEGDGPLPFTILEDAALNTTLHIDTTGTGTAAWSISSPASSGTESVDANGNVTYSPNPNANGSDTFTVLVSLNGQTDSVVFNITITPVNDAPSFTPGGNVIVNKDSGAYTSPTAWATNLSVGPANETGQTFLGFTATVPPASAGLFQTPPAINASTGVLTFTPAANTSGSVTVSVTLQDDGGTANGGVDTSAEQTFTITITPIINTVYDIGDDPQPGDEWSDPDTDTTPSGRHFLGRYNNQSVTLTLPNIQAHNRALIKFDLFVISSWDGNNGAAGVGPDLWEFAIDGQTMIHTTFCARACLQSYPGSHPQDSYPARTGATETGTLGYTYQNIPGMDSVYRFSYIVPHNASTLTLTFRDLGLQGIDDESWGLANVNVQVFDIASFPHRLFIPYARK